MCTASPEKQLPVLPTELEDDIARVASKKTEITVKMPIGEGLPTSWPGQVQLGRLKTHIATELFPKQAVGTENNLTLDETEIQLLFGGLVLEDVETLAALGVEDGAVIVVTWGIYIYVLSFIIISFFVFPPLDPPVFTCR